MRDFEEKTWSPDLDQSESNSLVTGTLHPDIIRRGGEKWEGVFKRDLARAVKLVFDGWKAPEKEPGRSWLVASTIEALSLLEELGPEVAFDVETLEAPATETPLVCFGVSDGTKTVVVPWTRDRAASISFWNGRERDTTKIVSKHLSSRTVVTHNGPSFDHIVADRYRIDLGSRLHDTITAYHVLESHLPKALPHVVTQYLDVPPWKCYEDRTADLERLYSYNMRDALYTILAWQKMKPILGAA